MLRAGIITLAAVLCPDFAVAQDREGYAFFAEKHMAFLTTRCPDEVAAYDALEGGGLTFLFESAPDAIFESGQDSELTNVLAFTAANEMSDADIHQSAVMITNILSVGQSLKFGSLFSPDNLPENEIAETSEVRRALALASVALTKCVWPTPDERPALMESKLMGSFGSIAAGMCDTHIYTLFQRFIDTPIVGMGPAEREAARLRILSEHDEYLEASKDPSQCGEFL